MDKSKLLDRVAPGGEDRILLARVLDRLEQARRQNQLTATDFLSPSQLAGAEDLLRLAGARSGEIHSYGGYEGAERRMILCLPEWMEDPAAAEAESPLRCLRAHFRPEDALTHRDILGSLMGLGIAREKIGDLLVGADCCDLMAADTVAEFLCSSWTSAGRARVRVEMISPGQLHIPERHFEEIADTVPSLRLDAVLASGFRTSRSRAAEWIAAGRVQVNWRECLKPDRILAEGDTVSARGQGKFQLSQVKGTTRKGRIAIQVKRSV